MQNDINKNFKKGRNYITISYFLGAMLFLFAYIHQTELWLLIVTIILLVATIVSIFIFNNLKSLFFGSPDDEDEEEYEGDNEDENEPVYTEENHTPQPIAYNKVYADTQPNNDQTSSDEKFTPLAVSDKPARPIPTPTAVPESKKSVPLPTAPTSNPAPQKSRNDRPDAQQEAKPFNSNYEYNSDNDDKIKETDNEKDDIDNYY